jgi:hypothetical protein
MFHKLTIVFCLISLAPSAVSAQEVASLMSPPSATTDAPVENTSSPVRMINLSPPAETVLIAAGQSQESEVQKSPPEQKRESRSSFNWGNFAEVHLGDYRWIWWVGAAAVLIAIHAGAN